MARTASQRRRPLVASRNAVSGSASGSKRSCSRAGRPCAATLRVRDLIGGDRVRAREELLDRTRHVVVRVRPELRAEIAVVVTDRPNCGMLAEIHAAIALRQPAWAVRSRSAAGASQKAAASSSSPAIAAVRAA
jgi:hypothetical protein